LVTCAVNVLRRPVTVTSAGVDGTLRVWDLRTGSVAMAFVSGSPIWCFGSVPMRGRERPEPGMWEDAYIVTGHDDGIVRRWDARKNNVAVVAWIGHRGPITTLTVHGNTLVTGSSDRTVRVWDAQDATSFSCVNHQGQVSGTGCGDDYVVSSGWDGILRCGFPL
jgi:F-box and WD-40 domain protein CDC4